MNSDDKCDSCGRQMPLTLTTSFEMLCAVCERDQCQSSLFEALAEKEAINMKMDAIKKMEEDMIKKLGKKN